MSLKKKLLVIALALGALLGFGAGFHHLCGHGRCHRGAASAWSAPCERGAGPHAGPPPAAQANL